MKFQVVQRTPGIVRLQQRRLAPQLGRSVSHSIPDVQARQRDWTDESQHFRTWESCASSYYWCSQMHHSRQIQNSSPCWVLGKSSVLAVAMLETLYSLWSSVRRSDSHPRPRLTPGRHRRRENGGGGDDGDGSPGHDHDSDGGGGGDDDGDDDDGLSHDRDRSNHPPAAQGPCYHSRTRHALHSDCKRGNWRKGGWVERVWLQQLPLKVET